MTRLPKALAFVLVAGGAGCGTEPPALYGDVRTPSTPGGDSQPVCAEPSTNGVPIEDRPNYEERLALYAADRARVEPGKTGWPDFPAVRPLLWSDTLGQAGRAHSTDMRDTPCFAHTSCDGTDPFDRIKSYWKMSFATMGENIAAGITDGITVIESSWINEMGAAPGETGHRENMFNAMYDYVGFGYEEGGSKYHGYWTQDFAGVGGKPKIPRLVVGSHFPQAANEMVTFGTVYFDDGGVAPERVEVVIDKKATVLSLARGKDAAGAYEGAVMVPAGCHRYSFHAITGGKVSCYPGTGTLGIGSADAANCPAYAPGE